ncbi:hypothetical protein A8F94_13700 [Bacillus sp. FJAT-27225]|uniref:hypothetical protein n=1 Tax=Bacillus sp. FJAT-27225 TaxID=1743144 RepID=UPI00080C2BEB|nr:hypothetical protein [Bacillus sp. FJAT-27225]OCA85901.1 hypothetical protein A8F94_13700 [Bacillus sp. FJAT-27225]
MNREKINKNLDDFAERLDRLEKSLKNSTNAKFHFTIHINDLHLSELNLEELAFHLEKLDIKELSGMLNLGNTFSPNVQTKKKQEDLQVQTAFETAKTESSKEDIQIRINGKPVSYSIIDGKEKNNE